MIKTIRVVRPGEQSDDYSWALSLSVDERINLATKLTGDLWRISHGTSFPKMDRSLFVRMDRPTCPLL